jgi:hypothetical protein
MNPVRHSLLLSLLGVVAVVVSACPRGGGGNVIDTPQLVSCEADEECPTGNLCIAGECRIGACNPAVEALCGPDASGPRPESCCKVFENCNGLTLTCERDPAAVGIGCPPGEDECIPCTESGDCVADLGFSSFCSGGRCFAQAGLTACSQDFQCATDERCDRTEFFCVKDNGGCRFCGEDFPELCCENGQACDVESGTCVDIGDRECTVETVQDDCRAGQLCDGNGRCVQCIGNDDCGPGTECNPATGLCVGTATRCVEDGDCPSTLRCIDESCGVPECESDNDCGDSRENCENFRCVLPPASCTENDEPNNTPDAAIVLPSVAAGYGGKLCRGDQDFVSFPVQGQKRYTVTVTTTAAPATGLAVTLFNTASEVESAATFASQPLNVVVVGVTAIDESGRFVLAINTGSNTERDEWAYTINIREDDASPEADCSADAQAGQEPNNDFATATVLAPDGAPVAFTRCGTNDADLFAITVPELNGVEVTLDGFQNAEGNLNLELYRAPSSSQVAARATTTANTEVVTAPEGTATYYAKVLLASASGVLQNQSYTIHARPVPRPADCAADVGENDASTSTASTLLTTTTDGLVQGSTTALRCNPQDVDHVAFTVPAQLGGVLRLSFEQARGDLRLDLLDAQGTQLNSSNTSSQASGVEAVDVPVADTERTYYARIQLGSSTATSITAQPWELALTTFTAAQCAISEPSSDGTFATGRCVGEFTSTTACNGARLPLPLVSDLSACANDDSLPGCGRSCGNGDVDVYRVGPLGTGRTVQATLRFDPTAGDLALQLAKMSGTTQQTVGSVHRDTDHDGVIEFEQTISGSSLEHLLLVKLDGNVGHAAQPYSLSVDVTGACVADANDTTTPGNATPATSTSLRATPAYDQANEVVNASLCTGTTSDVDVYQLIALQNETITVSVAGLEGVRLQVGTRPTNLTTPAITLPGGTSTAGADKLAKVTFTSATFQTIYLTLDRSGTADVGTYVLTLDYTQPVDGDGDGVTDDAGDPDDADACVPSALAATCDGDGDGTLVGADADDNDACVPTADEGACDFDGDGTANAEDDDIDNDGEPNATDAADLDPCAPNANAPACAAGDADGDGTTNADDVDDADPCVPDGDVIACDTGDFDGDGEPNATDADDNDVCVPTADEGTCDFDGDGTSNAEDDDIDGDGEPNATDAADLDVCVPTADEGSCDFDGDGAANASDDDIDGDGEPNATDDFDFDPCLPNPAATACTG